MHYVENKQQDQAEPQIQMQQHFKQDLIFVFLFIQFFRDVAWERDILSLRVKCKMNERGCDWTGQLRHYEVICSCVCAFF